MNRRFWILLLIAIGSLSNVTIAGANYPSPLPDFAHTASPRYPNYNVTVGNSIRPMLVLYEYFTDKPIPPGKGEPWAANRFFGGFPSVVDYFRENSHGRANFTPVQESEGAVNNGVIVLPSNSTYAEWATRTSSANNRRMLVAADRYINYAAYDRDRNGTVTSNELVIMKLEVHPNDNGITPIAGGGATRGVDSGDTLDGVSLNGQVVGLGNSATNMISLAHEVMHTGFGMPRDWYQYGIDGYDVMQATVTSSEFFSSVNSWNSMFLGWSRPTIVTRDGYRIVDEWDDSGQSYLLYDPAKGTNDYLLVENRVQRPGSYDANAGDNGLNVWRIDETNYYLNPVEAYPISRLRPCSAGICSFGGGQDYFSAFDPSDSRTPQRTVDVPWRDGTSSAVAIRAIGPANRYMRAYFDVPGPGILVDCFDSRASGFVRNFNISLGGSGLLTVPVMNTGDDEDTFHFTARDLPSGWSSATITRTLPPHEQQYVNIRIYAPADAVPNKFSPQIEGWLDRDSSYSSRCSVNVRSDVRVELQPSTPTLTGPTIRPTTTSPSVTTVPNTEMNPVVTEPDPKVMDQKDFSQPEPKSNGSAKVDAEPSTPFVLDQLPKAALPNYIPRKVAKLTTFQIVTGERQQAVALGVSQRSKARFTVKRYVSGQLSSTHRLTLQPKKGRTAISLRSGHRCPKPGRYVVRIELLNEAGQPTESRLLRFSVVPSRK